MTLPGVLRWALWPASLAVGGVARLRAGLYRRGMLKQRRLGGVVISVGNLTVGGTGKTPLVMVIAERLLGEGKRVGILTRGYRGVGRLDKHGLALSDEVAMMRARLGKKAQFGIGADRFAKGRMLERHGVEWFVLDDGFQYRQLARDADIVLIDAADPFGGGHLLPAGRLREPRKALARADVVVVTRSEHAPAVEAIVLRHTRAPMFYAQTELEGIFPAYGQEPGLEEAAWRAAKFFAFCAIGNPAAFFADLRRWGLQIAGEAAYRDHHWYSQREAEELGRRSKAAGAAALLCTEKDVFNLQQVKFSTVPVFFCRIKLRLSDEKGFWQVLERLLERRRAEALR